MKIIFFMAFCFLIITQQIYRMFLKKKLLFYIFVHMEQLVKFILATAGLTWILCDSILFKTFREKIATLHNQWHVITGGKGLRALILWVLRQLFKCPGCFGFWCGILVYFLVYVWELDIVVYPLIATICCYVLVNLGKHLERK